MEITIEEPASVWYKKFLIHRSISREPFNEDPPPHWSTDEVTYLMTRLLPKLRQASHFEVSLVWVEALKIVFRTFAHAGPMQNLGYLDIRKIGQDNTAGMTPFEITSVNATKLDRLKISEVPCRWDLVEAPSLTSLDLNQFGQCGGPSPLQFRNILRTSPRLQRLMLNGGGPFGPFGYIGPPVEMPELSQLMLSNLAMEHIELALNQFNAPNLTALIIAHLKDEPTPLIKRLTERNSFLKVQDLTFLVTNFSDEEETVVALVKWFDKLPHLRLIRAVGIESAVFHALLDDPRPHRPKTQEERSEDVMQVVQEREVLCPKLLAFSFDEQDVELAASFMEGRARLGVPFKRVFIRQGSLKKLWPAQKRRLLEVHPGPWFLNNPSYGEITQEAHEAALTYD